MSRNPEAPSDGPFAEQLVFVERPRVNRPAVSAEQLEVNRLLNRGIVFTVIWILGLVSLYSVLLATKAHRIIRQSNGQVRGMLRVWWCYLFGGLGIMFIAAICIAAVVNG